MTRAALLTSPTSARRGPAVAGPTPTPALVIGHRGAAGYRPENTLESYRLAIDLGADFIEPDLVSTRDGVLVARHENELSATTDVSEHQEFADRRTTKTIEGATVTGWFTEDFTFDELSTLRAKERMPKTRTESATYDGRFPVPTFQQVLDLARAHGVGVYPETKHPTYFASIGTSLEEPLVAALEANGYREATDPVIVQSFEPTSLERLRSMTGVRLVQLLRASGGPHDETGRSYDDLATPAGLAEIATYASGIGPNKGRVIPRTPEGGLGEPTTLVADAHAAGLVVHAYTFRSANAFLPPELGSSGDPTQWGDHAEEYRRYLDTGVDGIFSDHPDHARAAAGARAPGSPAATAGSQPARRRGSARPW